MCQQQQQQTAQQQQQQATAQMESSKFKSSYSIKRVLQTLFRHNNNNNKNQQQQQQQLKQKQKLQRHQKHQQQRLQRELQLQLQHQRQQRLWHSLESLESLENLRNTQMEEQHFYEEIEDNSVNEKLAELVYEEADQDIYVPVRFARTEAGTFFWTTNLQPVLSSFTPIAADEDLLQPSYCYSNTQYPHMQYPSSSSSFACSSPSSSCSSSYYYSQQNQDRWAQA